MVQVALPAAFRVPDTLESDTEESDSQRGPRTQWHQEAIGWKGAGT